MLPHPTLEKLHALNLRGMLRAVQEQAEQPEYAHLTFEERLGFLVDREMDDRSNRRLATRLKQACLRQAAVPEDIDFRHPRGLDRALMLKLATGQWVARRENCLITGPTGVGKTYLACALAHKACRENCTVQYVRCGRLFQELALARADGSYGRKLRSLSRLDLLVLDDWGITPLSHENRRDLLEILDDRYDQRATLVTSQLPVETWHDYLGDPTLADAILDRLVHHAHRLTLNGESLRKSRTTQKEDDQVSSP